jgi:hypothetical protein
MIQQKPKPHSSLIYGNGNAGKTMADLLATVPLLFHKTIEY